MASSKTGSCSVCGYSPVAFAAAGCPRCGAPNKIPSLADRFAGRGMLIGMGAGALVGAALGLTLDRAADDRAAAAIGWGFLGGLGGLIVGLFLGLVATVVADLFGRLSGRPIGVPTGKLIVPDPVEVHYCGHCRQRQATTDGEDCADCGRATVVWNPGREPEGVAHRRWADLNRES
jgi:hypothetical protein